jgi:hypothetical protein
VSYLHLASAQPMVGYAGVAAFPAGLSMLGRTSAPRLSSGHFGLAMSRVTIPADAVRLLVLSKEFRRMAKILDSAYVDHRRWIALREKNPRLQLNDNFRIVGGGFNGRRILYVDYDEAGSLFTPGQSIESPTGWDVIRFKSSLGDSDLIPWIAAVAHESAHAFSRVTAKRRGPSTPVQRVRAAVVDECTARTLELKVLNQIRATRAGQAALTGHTLAPVVPCKCERDWFPAAQKRTYLEQFVLGMDWESAARGLSTSDVEKITADVAAIPLKWSTKTQPPTMIVAILRATAPVGSFASRFPVLKSAAGQAAFVLRIVDASWRQLIAKVGEDSPAWTGGAQQRRLERHARVFFKIKVGYSKCP